MGDLDFQIILLIVAALVYAVGKVVEAARAFRRRTLEAERRRAQEERAELEADAARAPAPPRRVLRPRIEPVPEAVPAPLPQEKAPPPPAAEPPRRARRHFQVRLLLRTRQGAQTGFVLAEVLGPPVGSR
jgi:hypothetical protein